MCSDGVAAAAGAVGDAVAAREAADCFEVVFQETSRFRASAASAIPGAGLGFWRRIRPHLETFDATSASWTGTWVNSLAEMYRGEQMEDFCPENDEKGVMIEHHHFMLQVFRIPTREGLTLRKLCQVALNLGQLSAHRDCFQGRLLEVFDLMLGKTRAADYSSELARLAPPTGTAAVLRGLLQGSTAPCAGVAMRQGRRSFHVVGDALVDILAVGLPFIPAFGGDVDATSIASQAGGSALNTAVHLKALAGEATAVTFHGAVGQDAFAEVLRSRLVAAGVRPTLAVVPHRPTGSCVVLSGAEDRAFVTCGGATAELSEALLRPGLETALQDAFVGDEVHVHFGGLCVLPRLRQELAQLVRTLRATAEARGVKLTVSADVNGHEKHHIDGLGNALELLDVFKGNQKEMEAMARLETKSATEVDGRDALAAVARRLRSCAGNGNVRGAVAVATCGGGGAAYCTAAAAAEVPSAPGSFQRGEVASFEVEVCDTTGAGDAAAAALVHRWSLGDGLASAVRYACAAGAANCRRTGGCAVPVTPSEVDALLSSTSAACGEPEAKRHRRETA
eukprot:TRINITY_DN1269_c0_g2_i3.p1 TRINITY_DN1269_c0_g2~~TRINITY_DN1269_c0_g2_i3.p1  ORF type:complete len:588 (-),score=125.90 TRINITY_DN1269_c0_g2_i3:64-1758(-)